jgi:hypothetical protein
MSNSVTAINEKFLQDVLIENERFELYKADYCGPSHILIESAHAHLENIRDICDDADYALQNTQG